MREIKFRGRSTSTYRNVFGSLCVFNTFNGGKVYSIKEDDDNFEPVYEETIGQYTGLKDKNGVEIYEGDIVKAKYHELRDFGDETDDCYTEFVEEVMWLPVYNGFGLKIMIEDIPLYRPLDFIREVSGIKLIALEVIGNIHDNPELLECEEE